MPRAEVGSTKHIANQMKAKGLQRLRWYCQACQRQMRDENGFKCHVASESHVRNMQVIGEDPRKAINEFSREFERDFLTLLRTGHGEKKVNLNQFYQEYISNKEHMHMNATKWTSLSEFAKHLGRNGIVRVEEDEKKTEQGVGGASGLTIAWIDNSPGNLRRQEAVKKKERMEKGDEEREQRMIREQIRKAKQNLDDGLEDEAEDIGDEAAATEGIKRNNGEKVVLSFGAKKVSEPEKPPSPPLTDKEDASDKSDKDAPSAAKPAAAAKPGFSFGAAQSKPKNVFAAASKKNVLGGAKKPANPLQTQRPMSEAERIMKEELERKRQRESSGSAFKRQRVS
jgi:DNA/RNA-binding protein KIN17